MKPAHKSLTQFRMQEQKTNLGLLHDVHREGRHRRRLAQQFDKAFRVRYAFQSWRIEAFPA